MKDQHSDIIFNLSEQALKRIEAEAETTTAAHSATDDSAPVADAMARDTSNDTQDDDETESTPVTPVFIVTITKASELLGVAVQTVQRRLDSGELVSTEMHGKCFVKLPADVLRDDLPEGALDGVTLESDTLAPGTPFDTMSQQRLRVARGMSRDRTAPSLGGSAAIIAFIVAQTVEQIEAKKPRVSIAEKLVLTINECQELTGFSRQILRAAIADGGLDAKQIGRSWRVKRHDLETWVGKL